MNILGIDPGLDGFISCVEGNEIIGSWPMPTVSVSKNKRAYDADDMYSVLTEFANSLVVLEKQQAMPGQGVTSMFSTGLGFGLWQGLIVGQQMRCIIVSPKTWQKEMHKDISGDNPKAKSILAVKRLFPGVNLRATDKSRKDHDGKADSILLAIYGQRITKGA